MNDEYTIDVKNKALGRVASQVALILRGKNKADFKPNVVPKIRVKILNVSKIKLTGNKMKNKEYQRYSGYPGGLKTIPFQKMFESDPNKTFIKVVQGMLPKNKLNKKLLNNLSFE
ncbi:50S ribosomal protein L13 [Patescibacteria group bacterium]|nr:50S ribosomal protein L13 [Patescibacteria group bacterium]MBU2632979.1 50S ribosomal protein L13 [Patescibacteria group bacterium]